MSLEPPVAESDQPLLSEAARILPEIRRSFDRVLASFSPPIRRPRDISRTLGVHQTLAWRIMQVVEAKDVFAAARHLPGTGGLNIFLNAARQRGAPADVLDHASAAMAQFRKLIETHAGDRASLDLMLGAAARDGKQQADQTYRKAGYQCASYVWGVQAKARLKASIFYPDADTGLMRFAVVAGYVGLRRVRPQIRWTLWRASSGSYDAAAHQEPIMPYRPIDPDGIGPSGVPLLTRFCSQPLPRIERIKLPSGEIEDQWLEGPVGDKAAFTCFTGDLLRDAVPRYGDPQNPDADSGLQIRTPVETLVHDLFVHRDLFGPIDPKMLVYSELAGKPWYETAQSQRPEYHMLPFPERVEHLGRAGTAVHTPHVPQYEEMMRHVFGKLEWSLDDCDVYRLTMAYPVLATAVVLRFRMPTRPA